MTRKKWRVGVAVLAAALVVSATVIYAWELLRLVPWVVYIGGTILLSWAGRELGPVIWVLALAGLGMGVLVWWRRKHRASTFRGKAKGK
ncbi:MAG: hypothetical protein ACE5MH_09095 [Terriglobia bacterium]